MLVFQKRKNLVWRAGRFTIANKIQLGLLNSQTVVIRRAVAQDGASYNTDSDGNPNVFNLERNSDGLWLNDNWAKPTNRWNPNNSFVFRPESISFRAHKARFFFSGLSKLFLQPPNIVPISFSLSAMFSHCWLERSLPSQATAIINFNVSKMRMHSEILRFFFSLSEK